MSDGDTLTATLYIKGNYVFGALIKVRYDTSYFDIVESTERLSDFDLTAIRLDSINASKQRVIIAAFFETGSNRLSTVKADLLRLKLAAKKTGSTAITFYESEAYVGYDSTSTYLTKNSSVSLVNGTWTITIQ